MGALAYQEKRQVGRDAAVGQRKGRGVLVDNRGAVQRVEAAPNRTGLPDGLKAGVEGLSGMSLDHVRVHYNSEKPAQLQALAYAQGGDIHLGAGQESHLPHEAWHVVQQMQGRVRPTVQMRGVGVNDDGGLEREADLMGGRALRGGVALREKKTSVDAFNISANSCVATSNYRGPARAIQMKKLPRLSIATDLGHLAHRAELFEPETVEAFPRLMMNHNEMEDGYQMRDRFMKSALEDDPRIRYKSMPRVRWFSPHHVREMLVGINKINGGGELMYLFGGGIIGLAQKEQDPTRIHPRIFGGMPDVEMAGTVSVVTHDCKTLLPDESTPYHHKKGLKGLFGLNGKVDFTRRSGHYAFDSIPPQVRKALKEFVAEGGLATEEVVVEFTEDL